MIENENLVRKVIKDIRNALNEINLPDAKEWEDGTGGKYEKVLFFKRNEWAKFWKQIEEKQGLERLLK